MCVLVLQHTWPYCRLSRSVCIMVYRYYEYVAVIYVPSYCYIRVVVLLYRSLHCCLSRTAFWYIAVIHVSSYTTQVLILLYVSSDYCIHTAPIHMSSYYYRDGQTATLYYDIILDKIWQWMNLCERIVLVWRKFRRATNTCVLTE
jgi:hypothetical protein